MKLDFSRDRVLAVVAHPDDAELLCAGTLLRARSEGAAIGICILCQGDKGQPAEPLPRLAAVRRREARASAQLLQARLFHLRSADGELEDSRPWRRRLLEVYRRFRPSLILAHSEKDYHPDHRTAGRLAEAASWLAASRGQRTRSAPLDLPPALWWMDTLGMAGFEPGFGVDITPHLAAKEQLLACHASQLGRARDAGFAPLMEWMREQAHSRGRQFGVSAAEAFACHLAFRRARAW